MPTLLRLGRFLWRFPMTTAIVFVTIAAFLVQVWLGSPMDPAIHLRMGALRADRVVEHGELYRLVTPLLIHHGPIHLLLNLFALVQLALLVETLWGGRRLLLFYVVCGVVASLASAALTPPGYGGSVGASGAILGLAGVLLGATWLAREPARTWLRKIVGTRLLAAVILTFAAGIGIALLVPVIDNWAHLGGFVTGLLLAAAHPDPTEREATVATLGSSLAAGTVLAAVLVAAADGDRALETVDIDTARMLAVRLSNRDPSAGAGAYTADTMVEMLARFERAGAVTEGRDVFVRQLDRIGDPLTVAYLADTLFGEGGHDPTAARAAIERWRALAPDDPQVLNMLAWDLVTTMEETLRDPLRAEGISRRSLDLLGAPDDRSGRQSQAAFLDTLGEALYQLRKYDEAVTVQRRSVELARAAEVDDDMLGELEARLQKIEAATSG